MHQSYTIGIFSLNQWRPLHTPPLIWDDAQSVVRDGWPLIRRFQAATDYPYQFAVLQFDGQQWQVAVEM